MTTKNFFPSREQADDLLYRLSLLGDSMSAEDAATAERLIAERKAEIRAKNEAAIGAYRDDDGEDDEA